MLFGRKDAANRVRIFESLAVAVGYAMLFIFAWRLSQDQWYLPAGLRAASLLFLPMRLWPAVIIGDAAAVLSNRIGMLHKYPAEWVFGSSVLLMPSISAGAWALRQYVGPIGEKLHLTPLYAAALAIWMGLSNSTVNVVLNGPAGDITPSSFLKFALGYYLGMLLILLPCLLWRQRQTSLLVPQNFARDCMLAGSVIAALHLIAVLCTDAASDQRVSFLLLMLLPAVALTFTHGWRGAAAGVVMVNLAIGFIMPNPNTAGAHDAVAYVAQQALALTGTMLIVLGSVISSHYESARLLGIAEREALSIARNNVFANERILRSKAVDIAQAQAHINFTRHELTQWLRTHGHSRAALELNSSGLAHSKLFNSHLAALYPLGIEDLGLYAILQTTVGSGFLGNGAQVKLKLRGYPRRLSLNLQLAAYRSVADAVTILTSNGAEEIVVRARCVTSRKSNGGIVLSVSGASTSGIETEAARLASLDLRARAFALGGNLSITTSRVRVYLAAAPADADYLAAGENSQTGPATV
ncbi:hypothetical protein A7A76_07680 [Lysobacter enzymogenes]|uniref:MASE1 domain-containing protein n=1 Tax=Lysobacter enzymogenes TaxID=69 RepID=UPI0019D18FAD|nr:MASE1 domain-containing protein [Lysobacter enzymogenes]MBN7138973.1 hypothetical protein [Lysobacter enzymogenes]